MTDDNYNGYPHLEMVDGCVEVEWYKDAIGVPASLGERNMTFYEMTRVLCSNRTAPSPVLVCHPLERHMRFQGAPSRR